MTTHSAHPTVVPGFRYRDAPAAIEWLCAAFGFERHLVVPDGEGGIAHAQLTLGRGMIMLGSVRDDALGEAMTAVAPGGAATGGVYVIVDDVDAHYRRAVEHGARIVLDIKDEDYGGRGYTCLDPEGQVWSFGSYDPWAEVG